MAIKVRLYYPASLNDTLEYEIRDRLIDKYGGLTLIPSNLGYWRDAQKNEVIRDEIDLIEVIVFNETKDEVKEFFTAIAQEIKLKLKQESVLIEYEDTEAEFY